MLASTFRSNQPYVLLVLLVLTPALWGGALISITTTDHISGMPLFLWLWHWIDNPSWISTGLGMLLTIAVAIISNSLYNNQELFARRDHLSALLFIVLVSLAAYKNTFEPVLCALPIVLFAIQKVCDVYDNRQARALLFDAGLLFGISSMFFANMLYLLLPAMVMVQILRSFAWRDHASLLLGAAAPFILFGLIKQAFGLNVELKTWVILSTAWNGYGTLTLGAVLILFLTSVPAAMKYYNHAIMRIKNTRAGIAGFMLVFGILGLTEFALDRPASSTLLAVPAAYYGSFFFRQQRSTLIAETSLTVLLVLAFWVQWS
jgi:hypothetical protein